MKTVEIPIKSFQGHSRGSYGGLGGMHLTKRMCNAAPQKMMRCMAAAPMKMKECDMATPTRSMLNEIKQMKEMISKDSKSSSKIVEGKGYLSVACYQDTKGFFSQLPSAFIHLTGTPVPHSITEVVSDLDESVKVWITILSICILRKHFKDSQAEWTMISKKAETYLKQMKVKDFKQEIKNALSLV